MASTGSSPAPPTASATSRRQQRATHTIVSPTQNQHHQNHHQQHHMHQHGGQGQTLDPNNIGSNNTGNHNTTSNSISTSASPYPDVYAHPAAIAYAAAHPRRTIPKFGPYLLLQTLGEGEFGKVKLGLHSQWGEEVAVKLIRRGNVDSSVRMGKVEREIEVLKVLKHPNIVRLYDVIETDKYIGIVLEYASGGELFDHILAHRYLRERDAARLFSQLISGVWYIHQKKIVHRDLKLENLLLDRNRNVIITDFGFANRFEHRKDDLMQTSCGSPCYAAPELVISEGLYVGSAVDIWSCGVILYAMLAGYLPFDDDPANPDGDNINLLYKYIVSTPLSFPEYVSAEARELLSIMLVPDPKRRTTLEGVMRHSWLKAYRGEDNGIDDEVPRAFGKTVDELERAAAENHQAKRVAYQRQMRAAALTASGGAPSANAGGLTVHGAGNASAPSPGRTQSHRPTEHREHREQREQRERDQATVQQQQQQPTPRSRSTQPEYLYDSSVDQSMMSPVSVAQQQQPATPSSSGTKPKGGKVYGSPAQLGLSDDDPFGPGPPAATSGGLTAPPVAGSTNAKSGGGFRHTIQVEYDAPAGSGSKGRRRSGSASQSQQAKDKEREAREREAKEKETREREAKERENRELEKEKEKARERLALQQQQILQQQREQEKERERETERKPKPLPSPPPSTSHASSSVPTAPSAYRPPVSASSAASPGPTLAINVSSPPSTPTSHVPPPSSAAGSTFTTSSVFSSSSTPGSINTHTQEGSGTGSQKSTSSVPQGQGQGGHKKAKSSVDRIGLGKIFGGSSSSNGNGNTSESASRDASMSGRSDVTGDRGESRDGSVTPSAASVNGDEQSGAEKSGKETKEKEKKTGRRNTLTVMVEPFSRSMRGRKDKEKEKEKEKEKDSRKTPIAAAFSRERKASQAPLPPSVSASSATMASLAVPGANQVVGGERPAFSSSQEFGVVPEPADGDSGMQASTSKAKKVMQWFRTKSKGRESVGYPIDDNPNFKEKEKDATPTSTHQFATPIQAKYRRGYSASSSTVNQPAQNRDHDRDTGPATAAPVVVVTTPMTPVTGPVATPGTTRSVSGTGISNKPIQQQRTASGATEGGSSISASSFVTRFRNSVTAVGGRGSSSSNIDKSARQHNHHAYGPGQTHSNQVNVHPYSQLRIHHGAVDQTTITTRPPPEVMAHVKKVLEGMGLDMQMESEYKVRCVRVKKRKGTVVGGGLGDGQAELNGESGGVDGQPGQLAVVTMVGSAASNGVDKRGLPLPSPSAFSSTGGMLRGLLMRRQSSQVSTHAAASPSASQSASGSLAFDDEHSVVVGEPLIMNGSDNAGSPMSPLASSGSLARGGPQSNGQSQAQGPGAQTAYGDPSQDAGDEVRFSVELTRLDRLNDTYSLDIRRLKGNLRSYKFLYDTLRDRADLSAAH